VAPNIPSIIGRYCLKLMLLSYLSYLFRLRLLSEDSYLLEGLQSADKTETHPKAKLQNAPIFTRNGSHCHVCLLLVIKMKTCTYQLCKRQSADTQLTNWPIPIIGKTANNWPVPIIGASLILIIKNVLIRVTLLCRMQMLLGSL